MSTTKDDEDLRAAIHAACLRSARAMRDVKALSWFGRNHGRKKGDRDEDETKH